MRVNCIAPGYIATELTDVLPESAREALLASTPLGRLGEPEDIARCVRFLVSDAVGLRDRRRARGRRRIGDVARGPAHSKEDGGSC